MYLLYKHRAVNKKCNSNWNLIFRPNASINPQSLNNTQMTNSFYNLSHWCLNKVQENEKRKSMTGALVRHGLNIWSAFEKVINWKLDETDMLQVILT